MAERWQFRDCDASEPSGRLIVVVRDDPVGALEHRAHFLIPVEQRADTAGALCRTDLQCSREYYQTAGAWQYQSARICSRRLFRAARGAAGSRSRTRSQGSCHRSGRVTPIDLQVWVDHTMRAIISVIAMATKIAIPGFFEQRLVAPFVRKKSLITFTPLAVQYC